MSLKINDLSIGDTATIAGFERGNPVYREKLLAMGLTRGTEIKLVKLAPLGDPVEVLIRGFSLTLRKEEAGILKLERS